MTIDNKIRDEKLQYDINKEAEILALSSGKINKYEYLTLEKILPSGQSRSTLLFSFKKSFRKTNKSN